MNNISSDKQNVIEWQRRQQLVVERIEAFQKSRNVWLNIPDNKLLKLELNRYIDRLSCNNQEFIKLVTEAEGYIFRKDNFYKKITFCDMDIEYRMVKSRPEIDIAKNIEFYRERNHKYHGSFQLLLMPMEIFDVVTYIEQKDNLPYIYVSSNKTNTSGQEHYWNPLNINIGVIQAFESKEKISLVDKDDKIIKEHLDMIIDKIALQIVIIDKAF